MAGSSSPGITGRVNDRLSNSILSLSNLAQLIRDTSPTEGLSKLPKELLAKTPNVKNTGQILEQMPIAIVALDAHLDKALESLSELRTVRSLLLKKDSSAILVRPPKDEHTS